MRFICSLVLSLCLALTALAAPSYFFIAPVESPFAADRPIINGATYDDVRQTGAPTCCLMAALSAAARSDIDLGKNLKYLGDNQYSVRLFLKGKWTPVITSFHGWTKYDPAPSEAGEFWVSLYQRAYLEALNIDCSDADVSKWAVVKDGKKTDQEKDDQPWLSCSTALTAVTGRRIELWRLDSDDPDASIRRIRDALGSRQCVVVATRGRSDKELVEDKVCLVENHAYTVTAAGPDWIEVRNPWGFDIPKSLLTYKGRWKNGRPMYAYKDGFSDGRNGNDPNDGLVRVGRSQVKFFIQAYVTKEPVKLPLPQIVKEADG
jgi:hypothetical protein